MSERSLYSKLNVILRAAAHGAEDVTTLFELRAQIESQSHSEFLTLQYDGDEDDYVWKQSRRSIARAVQTARRLNLLDNEGSVTDTGRRALRSEKAYRAEVRSAVASRLRDGGAAMSDLQAGSHRMLRLDPPVLPTAIRLYERLAPSGIARTEFTALLNMLSEVDGAVAEQRRVYVAFPD